MRNGINLTLLFCLGFIFSRIIADDSLKEFQIKRKEIFEFTKEPTLFKNGDKVTIEFTVKDYCDATVAVQDNEGNIIRHLASGVLGDNAPAPFQQNSLSQKIYWDSKDDRGVYIDQLANISIRISLGLKPMYEKELYSSHYKRISELPCIATSKEGLYVYEGHGRDQLRLFGHNGEYIKTIYPFPASKIEAVKGIEWIQYANRNKVPVKNSIYHQTLLTSGDNYNERGGPKSGMEGRAATAINIQNGRIALVMDTLNRLNSDGSTGGFNLTGPKVGFEIINGGYGEVGKGKKEVIGPSSVAFSPDGKTIYMSGFLWHFTYVGVPGSLPAVMKMNYETDEAPTIFAGKGKIEEFGSSDDKFNTPTSVDTDSKGNVYVSDFWNNRIQIFSADGKLIGSIKTNKPAKVLLHKVTGQVYVFSYGVIGVPPEVQSKEQYDIGKIPQKFSSFSAFPECKELTNEDFPFSPIARVAMFSLGNSNQICLDSWSKNLAFWIVPKKYMPNDQDSAYWGRQRKDQNVLQNGIRRIEKIDGKWVEIDNFESRLNKQMVRSSPPSWNVQHMYFNPKLKKFYVGEGDSAPEEQAYNQLIEVDIESGKSKVVNLPINPLEIGFDLDGLIYLRTMNVVSRFNMETWKEVPFDYGTESDSVGNDGGSGGNTSPVVGALMVPATNAVCYHQGGFDVNANGDILVACHNNAVMSKSDGWGNDTMSSAKIYTKYVPNMFPGRLESSTSVCLHVWDKHGKLKLTDIVPGCPKTDGVFLDINNNVYLLATPPRKINNKEIDDGMSSTLFKFKSNKGKFLSSSSAPVPIADTEIPKRSEEVRGMWAENFDWLYGLVGYGGFNGSRVGGGCACWFVRFKLDYFARSFAPEPMQYSVSVLDSNGNLIVRVGKYGNADSCGPKSKEPLGGDEVGLFHPSFVGTDTDHRLFISDIGNERIVSVKLDYYVNKILPVLKK
jgi:hypothetical protein